MRNLTQMMFPNHWTYTYLHSLLFLAAFTATAYAYDRSSVLATSTIFGTNCSIRTEIIPSSKIALFRLEYFEDRENDVFPMDSYYAGPLILNNSNLINYPQISEATMSDCGVAYDVGSFSVIAEFSGSVRRQIIWNIRGVFRLEALAHR